MFKVSFKQRPLRTDRRDVNQTLIVNFACVRGLFVFAQRLAQQFRSSSLCAIKMPSMLLPAARGVCMLKL